MFLYNKTNLRENKKKNNKYSNKLLQIMMHTIKHY